MGTTSDAVYNRLAVICEEGKGCVVNYEQAEQYYLKAIELGSERAKWNHDIFVKKRDCSKNA